MLFPNHLYFLGEKILVEIADNLGRLIINSPLKFFEELIINSLKNWGLGK
jgi:hypothetical protein